jgi:hypothetical protein
MAEVPAALVAALPVAAEEPKTLAPAWVPTILLHIFYPDSRKTGFGWALFLIATYAAFVGRVEGKPMLDASTWLLCVSIAGALIGGGTIADAAHEREMAKLELAKVQGDAPPAAPAS